MDRIHILLEFLKIEHGEARQYESQRERLFGYSFLTTGTALAAIYADPSPTEFDVVLAGSAAAFNTYISVVSLKFYLAFKRRYERYRALRSEVSSEMSNPNIDQILGKADDADVAKNRYRLVAPIKIHSIWTALCWMMALITGTVFILLLAGVLN